MAQMVHITVEVRGIKLAKLLARWSVPLVRLVNHFSPRAAERLIVIISASFRHIIRVRAT